MKAINRQRASRKKIEIIARNKAIREFSQLRNDLARYIIENRGKVNKGSVFGFKFDHKKIIDVFRPFIVQASSLGFISAYLQLKQSRPDLVNNQEKIRERAAEYANQYALDRSKELSKLFNDSTKKLLRREIFEAVKEGETVRELSTRLKSVSAFSDDRAATIATTEIAIADVSANLEMYKESGVQFKRWITANDEKVSQDCLECSMQGPIPIGQAFKTGVQAPPHHPRCRCDLIPVV